MEELRNVELMLKPYTLIHFCTSEEMAMKARIEAKRLKIYQIFENHFFIWDHFKVQLYQHILRYAENYPKTISEEKIEWLKAWERRYDLLIDYLLVTLSAYLNSIGMTGAVKAMGSRLRPVLALNMDTPIPKGEEVNQCQKFPLEPEDLITPIFSMSLMILSDSNITTIWINHKAKILYTSPILNLSAEQQNQIMANWEKEKAKAVERATTNESKGQKNGLSSENSVSKEKKTKKAKNLQNSKKSEEKLIQTDTPKAVNVLQLRDEMEEAGISRSYREEDEETLRIDDLICPICTEQYQVEEKYPITLVPCGHTACQKCFEMLVQEKDSCPKCESLIAVGIVSMALIGTLKALLRQKAAKHRENRNSFVPTESRESLAGLEQSEYQSLSENEAENGEMKAKKLDRSKLRVTGLPIGWTVKIILKNLFNDGETIEKHDGSLIISTRESGRFLECVAHFLSEDAGEKAYDLCEQAFKAENLSEAKVSFLEVEAVSDDEIEQNMAENEKPSSSNITWITKTVPPDKKRLFISGLPKDFTKSDVIEKIVGGRHRLGNEQNNSIILQASSLGQNCIVSLRNEEISKECVANWNGQELDSRRLIVEYLSQWKRNFLLNYARDINSSSKKKLKPILPRLYDEIPFIADFEKSYLASDCTLKYKWKLVITGLPIKFSRQDLRKALSLSGVEGDENTENERHWGNICLQSEANFQRGFVYFTTKTNAQEARRSLIGSTEESLSGSNLQIELLEISLIERQNENYARTSVQSGDFWQRRFDLEGFSLDGPWYWPAKPKMRKLFISGIPINYSFQRIVFELLGGDSNFDNYKKDVTINRVDSPGPVWNCWAKFRDEKLAEKAKASLSDRILEGTHRILVETYGVKETLTQIMEIS